MIAGQHQLFPNASHRLTNDRALVDDDLDAVVGWQASVDLLDGRAGSIDRLGNVRIRLLVDQQASCRLPVDTEQLLGVLASQRDCRYVAKLGAHASVRSRARSRCPAAEIGNAAGDSDRRALRAGRCWWPGRRGVDELASGRRWSRR